MMFGIDITVLFWVASSAYAVGILTGHKLGYKWSTEDSLRRKLKKKVDRV